MKNKPTVHIIRENKSAKNKASRQKTQKQLYNKQDRLYNYNDNVAADTVTITLYCYNNTEAEIHQEYQQPTSLQ